MPAGVGATMPIFAERASGGIVVDVDGNSFIDLGAGIAVLNVGSSAPAVVEAVIEQVQRFTHTCFQVTGFEGYVELAERLNALAPGPADKRSFFVNSGAEAIENAVKIARSFTGRQAVVAFDHAFHGRTLLTMSLTAKAMPYKSGFGPFAPEIYRMPFSYPYRCAGRGAAGALRRGLRRPGDRLDGQADRRQPHRLPARRAGAGRGRGDHPRRGLPCRGWRSTARNTGSSSSPTRCRPAWPGRASCSRASTSGSCRTSSRRPRASGGGFPIGGVTGRADIMDAIHPGGLGTTFGGNPVCCAAALGALSEIESRGLVRRSQDIGEIFKARFGNLAEEVPAVGDVRIIGAMAAIEFVTDQATKEPDVATTSKVLAACHAEGVIVLQAGTYDNVVRIVPPLVISDDLLNDGLSVLEKAVRSL